MSGFQSWRKIFFLAISISSVIAFPINAIADYEMSFREKLYVERLSELCSVGQTKSCKELDNFRALLQRANMCVNGKNSSCTEFKKKCANGNNGACDFLLKYQIR